MFTTLEVNALKSISLNAQNIKEQIA